MMQGDVIQTPPSTPSEGRSGAPPPPGRQGLIPRSWAVGLCAIVFGLFVYLYWLSQVGSPREIEAVTAFADVMIALAAVFAIYVTRLEASGRRDVTAEALLRYLDAHPIGPTFPPASLTVTPAQPPDVPPTAPSEVATSDDRPGAE